MSRFSRACSRITSIYNAYQAMRVYNDSGPLGNLRDLILFTHDMYYTEIRNHSIERSMPEDDYLFISSMLNFVFAFVVVGAGHIFTEMLLA